MDFKTKLRAIAICVQQKRTNCAKRKNKFACNLIARFKQRFVNLTAALVARALTAFAHFIGRITLMCPAVKIDIKMHFTNC